MEVICCFVTDCIDATVLEQLHQQGVKLIALRCAGFNNVDIKAAKKYNIAIVRVPAYSPYAIAEFAVALILTLNRKIPRACAHVYEHNFLLDGLLGFDLHGKTVGVIGTGEIGQVFCQIMQGFSCHIIAVDPIINDACLAAGVNYASQEELYRQADIISLHCPLTPQTRHMIDKHAIAQMKKGVMLINTSRGAVVETNALIDGLKSGQIGYLGLDVYEEEEQLFFNDLSCKIIQDDVFTRLQTFPNVVLTAHQAFFTQEALHNIFQTTIDNLNYFTKGEITNQIA